MSKKSVRWPWEQAILEADPDHIKPMCRLVALTLATYFDAEGRCFPSVKTISERTGLAERTVRTHLLCLEQQTFLITERQARRGSGMTRVGYRATVPLEAHLPTAEHGPQRPPSWPTAAVFGPDDGLERAC